LEYILHLHTEGGNDLESQQEGWHVFSSLQGDDRLAGHTHPLSKLFLGYFAIVKAMFPNPYHFIGRIPFAAGGCLPSPPR
jgi:hypothetical protein